MNAPLDKTTRRGLSRRQAVTSMLSAAGGLTIGVNLPASAFAAVKASQPRPMGLLQSPEDVPAHELSAFLVIDPDDTVTIRMPHQECLLEEVRPRGHAHLEIRTLEPSNDGIHRRTKFNR